MRCTNSICLGRALRRRVREEVSMPSSLVHSPIRKEGQWDYTKPKHCKQAARCSPRNLQRDDFLQGKDVKQLFLNSSSGLQMLWDFCYGGLTLLDKPLTSFYLFLKLTHTNSICNRVCQFDWNQRYSNVKYQIHMYEFQFEELPCIESYRSSTVYQRVSGKRAY